jgi:hypothetical protein
MNPGFWSGKRVLVTGHTGFKGGWLVAWLRHLGAEVAGLALPPSTTPNLFDLAQTAQDIDSVFADIRDPLAVKAVFDRFQPEIVFHMAAQAIVRASYDDPVGTYATNVMGTVHVFEAVRTSGVRVVVNVTSDKCYDNKEWVWGYRETDPLGGKDPYSSSKACAELVTAAYRSSFFSGASRIGFASARAGNVIGGGDWAQDRLVPDVIAAIPMRCGPGSTCSSRCRATFCSPSICGAIRLPSPANGISAPRPIACARCAGWSIASRCCGVFRRSRCRSRDSIRTRRGCCHWIAPRRGLISAGRRVGASIVPPPPWWSGTRRSSRAPRSSR